MADYMLTPENLEKISKKNIFIVPNKRGTTITIYLNLVFLLIREINIIKEDYIFNKLSNWIFFKD